MKRMLSLASCRFLQTVLSSFRVVPLVVGDAAPEDIARLLRQLWGRAGDTDRRQLRFIPLPNYESARRLDWATAVARSSRRAHAIAADRP